MKTYVTLLPLQSCKLHGCHICKTDVSTLKHAEGPLIMAIFVILKESTTGSYAILWDDTWRDWYDFAQKWMQIWNRLIVSERLNRFQTLVQENKKTNAVFVLVWSCCVLLLYRRYTACLLSTLLKEGKWMELNTIMMCNTPASGGFVSTSL
jgi:hypothetical protein